MALALSTPMVLNGPVLSTAMVLNTACRYPLKHPSAVV